MLPLFLIKDFRVLISMCSDYLDPAKVLPSHVAYEAFLFQSTRLRRQRRGREHRLLHREAKVPDEARRGLRAGAAREIHRRSQIREVATLHEVDGGSEEAGQLARQEDRCQQL